MVGAVGWYAMLWMGWACWKVGVVLRMGWVGWKAEAGVKAGW